MASKKKLRKIGDERREFKSEWTESFAFIANSNGLPTCLIYKEQLANNKKSNVERHFQIKHSQFATTYPIGDLRKKAVKELQESLKKSTTTFYSWLQSANTINIASFLVSQEIAKRGKPFTGVH
ncbi:hypothetical protein ABEB36_009593 [Hypothenemus hampei]|uniref:Uncharacterized protein n=1 Tax=Hypothenemus hampei TaxID=57062 RepID=A0ABD1EJ07_HYPHA